jgi:hypothetical protein
MLVSRRKRYLSGSDWVIGTLDRAMKSTTCSGNMSQVVLLLEPPPPEGAVRERLIRFARRFPVLQGKVARDIKLAPYWKIPPSAEKEVAVNVAPPAESSSPEGLMSSLARSANGTFRDEDDHIAFHLFPGAERGAFAMTFDHRLFDARGAESFLDLFQRSRNGDLPQGDIAFASTAALTEWKRKFLAGRNVNRRIIALSRSSPRALPFRTGRDKAFRYRLLSFDERETAGIYDRAYRESGYLLESPYFLAAITQTLHELFKDRAGDGESYLVPVTTDLRPGQDPLQELFFNHVSYLFYQIPARQGGDMKELVASFRQQMYEQVKSGFHRDLAEASLLTRIVPRSLFGKLMHLPLKGRMATFAFSHLGKSAYRSAEFLGGAVKNVFHMPRVPVPPGLGFFSNLYGDRLNLVVSYLDGMLSEEDVRGIETGIRRRFGAPRE